LLPCGMLRDRRLRLLAMTATGWGLAGRNQC
jgi:hypothetical protein